jgi:hypothetical protein
MSRRNITRDSVTELFRRFAGQINTITIPRPYIDLCGGDHLAALLLSQILYWSDRTENPDGWFAKSYEQWHEELAMTQYQVIRAIKGDRRNKNRHPSLTDFGVETKLLPSKFHRGSPTLHYRVNLSKLELAVINFVDNAVMNNVNNEGINNVDNGVMNNVDNPLTETIEETIAKSRTENKDSLSGDKSSQLISETVVGVPVSTDKDQAGEGEPKPTSAVQEIINQVISGDQDDEEKKFKEPHTVGAGDKMTTRRQTVELAIFAAIGLNPENAVSSVWGKVRRLSKWLESMEVTYAEFRWFEQQIREAKKLSPDAAIYITLFLDGTTQSRYKDYLMLQRKRNAELDAIKSIPPEPEPALPPIVRTPEETAEMARQLREEFARAKAEREKKPERRPLWELMGKATG